jgi:Holliday junction resolvase RusA-like endonuclease
VPGVPQSKGSRTQVGPGRNIEAGTSRSRARKKSNAVSIRDHVYIAMRRAGVRGPLTGPVRVDAWYHFPIARSRLRGKHAIAPGTKHTQKPDRDKCNRQVGDALTASGLVVDDCIDADGFSAKRWCLPGEERTEITISWEEDGNAGSQAQRRPRERRRKQDRTGGITVLRRA